MIRNHESYLDDGWEVKSPLDTSELANNSTITAFTPTRQLPDDYDPGKVFSNPKSSGTGIMGSINQMISAAELSLSNRLDLIPDGFCSAYMTKNVNLAWGRNNYRKMPFEAQFGANKGARVFSNGNITMDSPGTWTAHLLMNCDGTGFTGSNEVCARVELWSPSSSVISTREVWASPGGDGTSIAMSEPFIVPEEGCFFTVHAWSGKWRWWKGGTRLSGFTVVKNQQILGSQGQDSVRDETEAEANG